jgi:hypothetical protein
MEGMEGHLYAVGWFYNPLRRQWPEGAQYGYRDGGHELLLFFRHPSPREVRAVESGPGEFALVAEGPLIVLLYQFRLADHPGAVVRPAIPWGEALFTIHRVPLDERVLPELPHDPDERALLTVMLIDADSGIIHAIRALTFPPAFTAELEEAIRQQAALPYDSDSYERLQAGLERRYPTTEALLSIARARCDGGGG